MFWEVGSSSRWFVEECKLQGCVLLASKTASQAPTLVERNDCGEGGKAKDLQSGDGESIRGDLKKKGRDRRPS